MAHQQQTGNYLPSKTASPGSVEDNCNAMPNPLSRKKQVRCAWLPYQPGTDSPQTSQDTKQQRNRQAQKAFRERRTERLAHLELSMENMTKEMESLQRARSDALEELMMVKYKNSLLERLLLEKRKLDIRAWTPN
jgi:hypothetical protein